MMYSHTTMRQPQRQLHHAISNTLSRTTITCSRSVALLLLVLASLLCSSQAFQSIHQHARQTFSSSTTPSASSSSSSSQLDLFRRRNRNSNKQRGQQRQRQRLFDLSETTMTRRTPLRYASKEDQMSTTNTAADDSSSWSRKGGGKQGSRFGVRRRVRSVLEKARRRTGVPNDSADAATNNSGSSFISEVSASIGAFAPDTEADFVFTKARGYPQNTTQPLLMLAESAATVATPSYTEPTTPTIVASSTTGGDDDVDSDVASVPEPESNHSREPVADGDIISSEDEATSSSSKPPAVDTAASSVEVDSLLETDGLPLEPLPFTLPTLSAEQEQALQRGERVQEQSKMGREGSGYVVMDIPAPAYAVWECLLDFEKYPENIGTVRSMRMFTNTHLKQTYISEQPVPPGTGMGTRHYGNPSISRAAFVLSKFRFNIAAIHQYQPHPDGHYMIFSLDRACANVILQDAKGIWYTQENPDTGMTRVYLLCELRVSKVLPTFIVDYAAKRAMPRATEWLRPTVADFCSRWQTGKEGGSKNNIKSIARQ